MIQATELRKSYGTVQALDGVSLTVAPGEVYGLLGPNGAGKTTCMGLLVGALSADSGSVNIGAGGDPRTPDVRRRIGYAPQALALYDDLTGLENVNFFGRLYGLAGAELRKRAAYVLDLAGLTDRATDRVSAYSGGMKRRLNLACALVHDPPVLLLDEPTVGVDPQSRNLIFERIESLKSDGRTVIYTTHYMEEAQRLCDRIAIVDHGRTLAEGDLETLLVQHGGHSVVRAVYESAPPAGSPAPGSVMDGELRFESDQPLADVARLVESGHRFRTLRIDQPDLETVFLNLTGRSLRDG